jgi:ComF family protein
VSSLHGWSNAALSVLIAPRCLTCGSSLDTPIEGPVCGSCWQAVVPITPPFCRTCGDPLPAGRGRDLSSGLCVRCRRQPALLSCARAAGPYDGVLRQLLHALKYEGRRTLAIRLSALMRERGRDVLEGADVVVPVPLHWRRRYARGFNQAEDLARGLGPPIVHALRRVRANVQDAFAPPRRGLLRRRRLDPSLRGACVVLVDDVCTTGATLEACAAVLRAGGVRDVRALTAARAASIPRG